MFCLSLVWSGWYDVLVRFRNLRGKDLGMRENVVSGFLFGW